MACMIVLYVSIPLLCLTLSSVPLLTYFTVCHKLRRMITHPFLEGILLGIFCWVLFTAYLLRNKTGPEVVVAMAISIVCFFGFSGAGALIAFFYKKKRGKFFLFPPHVFPPEPNKD